MICITCRMNKFYSSVHFYIYKYTTYARIYILRSYCCAITKILFSFQKKNFILSHRIFGYMHEVLNIDQTKTNYTYCV